MSKYTKAYRIYYKELQKNKLFPQNVVKKYIESYQKYNDKHSLSVIVDSNQKYVQGLAYKSNPGNFDILDLINEGNIGLINAVNAFDLSRGNTFLSFATARINKEILMHIDKFSSYTHVPYNIVIDTNKIKKFIQQYINNNGEEPTVNIISKGIDLPKNKIVKGLRYIIAVKSKNENKKFEDIYSTKETKDTIDYILENMNKYDKELLCKYFGIKEYYKISIEELSEEYETTPKNMKEIITELIDKVNKQHNKVKNNNGYDFENMNKHDKILICKYLGLEGYKKTDIKLLAKEYETSIKYLKGIIKELKTK